MDTKEKSMMMRAIADKLREKKDEGGKILSQEKSVPVIDSNQKVVGVVGPSKVIHTVFGGRNENS